MRIENDAMGSMEIPDEALWGAQTQRALENFPISGLRFGRYFIRSLGRLKWACARANIVLGGLEEDIGNAILRACDDVVQGKLDGHFPLDVFQTGSGTSTNMNANEVIANRAIQLLCGEVGSKTPVHPNDHVNMSQSSNDVIPTVIHVAGTQLLSERLIPALASLQTSLDEKAEAYDHIIKTGRTHLQDATPIRLGQVFGGYATQVRKSRKRAIRAQKALQELPLGGTAVGTGLNRQVEFPLLAINFLNEVLETDFKEAEDHVEANAARDGIVEASGQIKTIAVSLSKIANDIRFMASGPRNGLGEISLPAVQPGSSIMPGKVNPVMAEALIMVSAQVIGNDVAITQGGLGGYFELNLMMPLLAYNLLQSIECLANAVFSFNQRCVTGIKANEARCHATLERNLSLVTGLAPVIGYDQASSISKDAYQSDSTIREVALDKTNLSKEELDIALDPRRMTEPGIT
jgi:fumarate hydratase class II